MLGTNGISAADIAAVTGNNGFGGESGWIAILLVLALCGGYGFGGMGGFGGFGLGGMLPWMLGFPFMGGYGYGGAPVTNGDLQRGFDTQSIIGKLNGLENGMCSLGYDQLAQMNGINTNIMTAGNNMATQLADCCCRTQSGIESVKTADVMNTMNIMSAIKDCCCDDQMRTMQAEYNAQGRARDIQDTANANTRAILEKLCQMENNAKDEKIASQAQRITQLEFERSQIKQNEYIHDLVKPPINPAYLVAGNPYCSCGNGNPFYPYGPYFGGTTVA